MVGWAVKGEKNNEDEDEDEGGGGDDDDVDDYDDDDDNNNNGCELIDSTIGGNDWKHGKVLQRLSSYKVAFKETRCRDNGDLVSTP